MPVYPARIPITDGDTVRFDGETYLVTERHSDDEFVVEHAGEKHVRHIDWFADQASKALRIEIERGGA